MEDAEKAMRYPRMAKNPKQLMMQGIMDARHVLFFIHLESRCVSLAGITRYPEEGWMEQMARNAADESWGYLERRRYALHDRDTKFCASFRATLASGGIKAIQLPACSRNLNAFAERWGRRENLHLTSC